MYDPNQARDPLGKWVKEHNLPQNATANDIVSGSSVSDRVLMLENRQTPQAIIDRLATSEYEMDFPYDPKRSYESPNGVPPKSEKESRYNYRQKMAEYDRNIRLNALEKADRETVDECRFDENPHIRAKVAELTEAPRTLDALAEDSDWRVRMEVARNGNTGMDTVRKLAEDETTGVQANILEHHDVDAQTIDGIVGRCRNVLSDKRTGGYYRAGAESALRAAAKHRNTSPDTLAELSRSDDRSVREGVADNPHTPEQALTRLAADPDDIVREHTAYNPNTPTGTLEVLADDDCVQAQINVADNPNASPDTLDYLSEDWLPTVRAAVARNVNSDDGTLRKLTEDENRHVRMFARRTMMFKRAHPGQSIEQQHTVIPGERRRKRPGTPPGLTFEELLKLSEE